MKIKIRLDTKTDAIDLCATAETLPDEKVVITDNNGMCVSAKSIMGALYAMEFEELWLETEHDHWYLFQRFEVE
jgi:hypothetical protein